MRYSKLIITSLAAGLAMVGPAQAQETPSAGTVSGAETWGSMPVGSYIMIGGFIFIVTAGGLTLLDDDDNNPPSTTTPPTTTTTSTTTTS